MITASRLSPRALKLPASQTAESYGLQLSVKPNFWLRRLLHFPFYFDSTNPTFRVEIKRVKEDPGANARGTLNIQIVTADGSTAMRHYRVPNLSVGASYHFIMEGVTSAHLGQTMIRLPAATGDTWQLLYAYQVRSEEQLWTAVVGPLVGAVILAGGALIQKMIGVI